MANTVAFTWPKVGATVTAPLGTLTAKGTVTCDGATAATTITHNLGFSAAELTEGFPEVVLEPTNAAFYTEVPRVTSKTANTVVITGAGSAAATFNFTIRRPLSSDK